MNNTTTTNPGTNSLSRGSEWRKWDLHIHSPLAALNNQFPHLANGEADWEAFIAKLESLPDISVLGITDYFTIEGYRRVRELRSQGRLAKIALILPNIEFRLDKIITTSGGNRRLNYHVIFSDRVSPEEIEEHFLQELKFCYQGDPQRADLNLSVRRTNLELLGRRLKEEHPPFRNGRSDFEIGCMNATVDPGEIKRVLDNKASIFKGKFLIVLAEENLSLLDWDDQAHHTRKLLLQGADAIFSSNDRTIHWARGEDDLNPDQFRHEFRSLKACLHGSDAHRLEDIARPAEGRYCWIKAEPTFEGLKQILYEPGERVFIGDEPPNLKNDYQVIESVKIASAPDWFGDLMVPLNEDMISIIGPRGSGKSALAEVIAFAGGAGTFRTGHGLEDTFLYKAARKSTANPNTVVDARVTVTWKNGESDTSSIPASLTNPGVEEKVKYLPQKFVEWLCAPENDQELEAEIEKVIYQRNKKTDRLQASNFQELRKATTQPIETKRQRLIRTIQSLNASIADATARVSLKPKKQTELKQRQEELARLLKKPPTLPAENKEELDRLDKLEKEKQELELKIVGLTEQLTVLGNIEAKFAVLKQDIESFNREMAELLPKAGLTNTQEFIVGVPDVTASLTARRNAISKDIQTFRGPSGPSDGGTRTLAQINHEIGALKEKSKLTEAKKKEYEKFQKDKQKLEELITSITREVEELDKVVTPKIKADREERLERYLDAFDLLREEREVLEQLYDPLKQALQKSNETAKKLTFISRTTFNVAQHAARGIELFDRRKSAFPDKESLEVALTTFFESLQQNDFERSAIKTAAHTLLESFKPSTIPEQLRSSSTPKDFADWFFDIGAFSTTYGIKFDNKDLRFLSPGEKGIVLLLLYLEAEEGDNRPLIIDQPDDNLDNLSVYPNLIEYFRTRKKTRQIIIITHNPNLVVATDSEQVVVASFDGTRIPKISYRSGALEDTNPGGPVQGIREDVCKILEGGTEAFQLRERRYALPGI
jgi:hypothetical protein